jgi:AraC-like DNA-binding protein
MTEYVPHMSSGWVLPFVKTAMDQDVDAEAVLAVYDLSLDNLKRQQTRIPIFQTQKIIHQLVVETGDELLGLHAVKHVNIGSFDIRGYIAANCSNVFEAMTMAADLQQIVSDHRTHVIIQEGNRLINRWVFDSSPSLMVRNTAHYIMASYVKFGTEFMQLERDYEYASFQHEKPTDPLILQLYADIFQCPLHFEMEHYEIAGDLEKAKATAIPQADLVLRDQLLEYAHQRIRDIEATPPFIFQIKGILKTLHEEGDISREKLAQVAGISGRTLQRRLKDEGSSYKHVLATVRLELIDHYMNRQFLSIDQTAFKLGFSEPSAFHRYFKQEHGLTLGQYRDNQIRRRKVP